MLRTVDQAEFGFEHGDARTFAADDCSRHMETVFRKELIEVIAGDAPGNIRISRANERGVLIANRSELGVDSPAATAPSDEGTQFCFRRRANVQFRAIVEQNAKLFDIINRLAGEQGMSPARIVPYHSAQRASAVGGRIRTKCQMVNFGALAQAVQHDPRLNARNSGARIELQNLVHVFGEIQNNRDIAALAGKARASPTRQNRSAIFSACGYGCDHIIVVSRNHQADGNLTIVGSVCGVERATAAVEAHLSAHGPSKFVL